MKTKTCKDVLALNSIVLNVFGRRMAATQSSHKTAGHKTAFPEQKENTYALHSILYPIQSSCSHKGTKSPFCPNHRIIHSSLPSSYVNIQYIMCELTVCTPECFLRRPPALPQAAEARIREDHLLAPSLTSGSISSNDINFSLTLTRRELGQRIW